MIRITIYFQDGTYLDTYVDDMSVDYKEGKLELHSYDEDGEINLSFNMKTDGIKAFRIGASS